MDISIKKELKNLFKAHNLAFDVLLKDYTTFNLGGPADIFFKPKDEIELINILKYCKEKSINYFILGKGSNILVGDKGYRGCVIYLSDDFSSFEINKNIISSNAGISLAKLSNIAMEKSLSGLEFASGIPGSLGGAIYMNAGAYGHEIKDLLLSVRAITDDLEIRTYLKEELEFSYRKTTFMDLNAIVLSAVFLLEKDSKDKVKSKMQDLNSRRREKQPLEFPSAGSVFKRPEGYYAGKLIMDSGLAGYRVGGASVSDKHCGFIINDKNASSADVVKLIEYIREKVFKKFNVNLERELRYIGEF